LVKLFENTNNEIATFNTDCPTSLPTSIGSNNRSITNMLHITSKTQFLNSDSCLLRIYEPLNILSYFQTLSLADVIKGRR
jgi:hypothetical protein